MEVLIQMDKISIAAFSALSMDKLQATSGGRHRRKRQHEAGQNCSCQRLLYKTYNVGSTPSANKEPSINVGRARR